MDHPSRQVVLGEFTWKYVTCGTGTQTVLLLPGGFGVYESLFPLIDELKTEFRVVAVSLPRGLKSLSSFARGIAEIQNREAVDSVHVVGQSFGGWLAQQYAIFQPQRVTSLVLLHAFVVEQRLQRRLKMRGAAGLWLIRKTPRRILNVLLRRRVSRILISPLARGGHPDLASWRQLLNESVGDGRLIDMVASQATLLRQGSLDAFAGAILIVESDNDPVVPLRSRLAVKRRYRQAAVVTLAGTGHVSAILATKQVARHLRSFFEEVSRPIRVTAG